jgi:hypothetical protein
VDDTKKENDGSGVNKAEEEEECGMKVLENVGLEVT